MSPGNSTRAPQVQIDYRELVAELDDQVVRLIRRQVLDGSRPDAGGFVSDDGMAGGSGVGAVALLGYAYLLPESRYAGSEELLDRICAAAQFARRVRRGSGRLDLIVTNFDSAPDTAFVVQALAPLVKAARTGQGHGAAVVAESIGELIRASAPGIASGGFHTPNHRWVILSALSQALELFPELPVADQIDAYLGEGIDINEDGDYTERSAGVYNAICNRSLRLAAAALERPDLLEPVRRNLELSYHLLDSDATIVAALSTRQDRNSREVPVGLVDSYYAMAHIDANGFYAAVADWLWSRGDRSLPWVLHPFLEHPEWRTVGMAREELPVRFTKLYSRSGLWRHRDGLLSASVAAATTRPFSLSFGDIESMVVKICSTYFATGQFVGEQLHVVDGRARLCHRGRNRLYSEKEYDRPVYWLPLGREVKSEDWRQVRRIRPTYELEPLQLDLEVALVASGFDLRLASSGGVEDVPVQLEFLFPPGGELELSSGVIKAMAGGTAFLKAGTATYTVGDEVISVGPGNHLHRMWNMRNSEQEPDVFRLLITLLTPVDWTLEIRCATATTWID